MEKQLKQENVEKNKTINKKKNKNKEKKRLMSLFRGPKVDHKFYYKVNEEEVNAIKESLIEIMSENPSLKLHKEKNKINDKIDSNESDSKLKITNELILGLNAMIRSIEKKSTIGVIITDPLAIQLIDNIIDLCEENSIPCLSVESFDEMKTYLNISSLSGIAFKPNISSSEALFYKLYQTFLNIVNKKRLIYQNISDTNQQNESLVKDISESVICFEAKKNADNCEDKSLYDLLYTKESDDNYSEFVRNHIKQVNDSYDSDINVIVTQQSFLPFCDDISQLYFPQRVTKNQIIAKIEVKVNEEIKLCDESFAESLMEESVENVQKVLKRKSCQIYKPNSISNYREPEIVRLEPSIHKIQNRQQRKVSKKNKFKS